ncbi:MAG: (2Fe-2S)-binding protein [Cytophagaceae bacterium]|nr:(2Fe-2S)-binding protein [Gemmatimonadaceae bacterium]
MRLTVNARPRDIVVADDESLLTTLRDRLALTGAKRGCDRGECGTCTVLLDGEPTYSCLALTRACEGARVMTIEGMAAPGHPTTRPPDHPTTLHPVQRAFIACDAVQCGYCTPGQVLAAVALLERSPDPTDAEIVEAMSGNLCRCGTYPKIAHAIREAAAAMRAAPTAAP